MDAFFKRLEFARTEFMNKFLQPQIEEIAKIMNFKSVPKVKWKSLNFRDNSAVLSRVYTRLLELGAISPNEAITAIQDNRLPDYDELLEDQEMLLKEKEKGYYQPLLNNNPDGQVTENGRPSGTTGVKQTTQKITPSGQKSVASYNFGVNAISETLRKRDELEEFVCASLRSKHNIKKLSSAQKQIASDLTNLIIGSEDRVNWQIKANDYIDNPLCNNTVENPIANEIFSIAAHHGVTQEEAAILYHSQIK
jgi:hypothetical protein